MPAFFDDGLHFECNQCSRCCRIEPGFVFLSQSDLTNLCRRFDLSEDEFIKTYCRMVPRYDDEYLLCLKDTENYDCILWKDGCSAYDSRPVQCRTYPFWTGFLTDEESWRKEGEACPGINRGKLWTKDEINASRTAYENNEPLRFKRGGK